MFFDSGKIDTRNVGLLALVHIREKGRAHTRTRFVYCLEE